MNDSGLYSNKSQPIPSRQGSGMCQLSSQEIMIMGGFNGKFMGDYYVIKVNENGFLHSINQLQRNNAQQNLFPFQVPTVGDSSQRSVLSIDWSGMNCMQFVNNSWSSLMSVKN